MGPVFPKDWKAPCRGLWHVFFAPDGYESKQIRSGRQELAKSLCEVCSQQLPCLEWALDNAEPFGVWGGLDEVQRRKVRARRRIALQAASA